MVAIFSKMESWFSWLRRCIALAGPGDDATVSQLVSEIMEQSLDRTRPLWECWIIDILADGRWAVLTKIGQSVADELAAEVVSSALAGDTEPPPAPKPPVGIFGASIRLVQDSVNLAEELMRATVRRIVPR